MRHYAAYGDPFGAQGSLGTPFGFTGEQTDGNRLVYLRARHYAPSLGIFPSLDPFEGDLGRPMSLNGYSWVEGNVTNWTDKSGLEAILNQCNIPKQVICPSADQFVPPPDYSKRVYVDTNYARYEGPSPGTPYYGDVMRSNLGMIIILELLTSRAEAAGNVQAAKNLKHWLRGSGVLKSDYDVEQMIADLPKWQEDITEELNLRTPGVISFTQPQVRNQECSIYVFNTSGGITPSYAGQRETWRRVGQPSGDEMLGWPRRHTEKDIYGTGIDIRGQDFPALISRLVPISASYSRAEFDWFIAMNAFDYSIAMSIALDKNSGDATICYRIDIADEYVWYGALGGFDEIMARAERMGVGKGYEIRGSSVIRCEQFNERNFGPDARYSFNSYSLRGLN